MFEVWKPIDNYEGYYEISNFGRVRSLDRYVVCSDGRVQYRKGKLKIQTLNQDGYYTVKLSKNGKDQRIGVHSLVCKAFVPGYFDGAETNHIDCDRTNNCSDNLEWVSHFENIQHSINMGNHISVSADLTGSNNPNYGNHKLHNLYEENKSLSKLKQSRLGKRNGMATPISVVFNDGKSLTFDYIGECATYLILHNLTRTKNVNAVRTAITKSIKENRCYQGLKFQRI